MKVHKRDLKVSRLISEAINIEMELDEKILLFGEDVGKYIIVANNEEKVKKIAEKSKINLFKIGITKKNHLNINNEIIKLSELKKKFENNFFNYINN